MKNSLLLDVAQAYAIVFGLLKLLDLEARAERAQVPAELLIDGGPLPGVAFAMLEDRPTPSSVLQSFQTSLKAALASDTAPDDFPARLVQTHKLVSG